MEIGIHAYVNDETIHPRRLGPALEERGFDALYLPEHSHIPVSRITPYPLGGDVPRPYYRMVDPFVALGLVAAVTTTLRLGTGVCLLVQRDPIQAAKEVSTLDYLSGGRVRFGIGVGWLREEMANHGTDPRTRGAVLDERMAAMIEIWTRDEAEFHGQHVDFDPITAWPKPIQRPHPPIYVGGNSPAAIARARRFGSWLPSSVTNPERAAEQVASAGPDVPVIPNAVPPKREFVDAYKEAGAAGIVFHLDDLPEPDALRKLDEFAALLG
jgi:probable F420-dependent oxidoreductase